MILSLVALMNTTAAPTVDSAASTDPDVIVVTATPLADQSDALSQGVSVVTRAEALSGSMGGGLGEVLSGLPGVRSTFYGANASRPIIRGLGEDRIRLMLNGLAGIDASTVSPDHAPAIDGLEADRIEVLRGPAALRYGGNAIGGVVNVVDGRLPDALPTKPFEGELFLGFSTVEKAKSGAFRISASANDFVFRVDGLARSSDDYEIPGALQVPALALVTGDTTRDVAFNTRGEIWAVGASGARIKDRSNLALSVRSTKSNYGIPGEEAFIDLEQTRVDARGVFKDLGFIDTLTVTATAGDYTHSEIEFDGAVGTVFENSGYEGRVEARHKPFGSFDGVVGVQFGANDFAAAGEEAFILPVTIRQAGIFAVERFSAGSWGAELGARGEQRRYSGLAGRRNFDLASVSGSAFVKPIDTVRLSVSASLTERAPTEVELFADGPHAATAAFEIGDPTLKKETAHSVEVSARWQLGGWTLTADLWQADFDGFIAFEPTGEIEDDLPVFEASQRDATLKGFELGLAGNFWSGDGLSLGGDVALDFVEGRYKGSENIARIPPRNLTLGLEAKHSRFGLRGEVQVTSDQKEVSTFELPTEGSTVYNMRATWIPFDGEDGFEVVLEGRNLSDEEVREHTSFLKNQLPKPGRSVRLSVRARF